MNYKHKYQCQRNSAIIRGIDWQFTLDSWLAWWGDDIVNRGRKSGQLVMARIGDQGPYHPANVRKLTCGENYREAHIGNKNTAKRIKTPIGIFDSMAAAKRYKNLDYSYYLKTKPMEYYYI